MEKHPIRDGISRAKVHLGQLVLGGMERFDDAHDVFGGDDELQDTQEFDTAELLRRLKEDDDESHIVRGED